MKVLLTNITLASRTGTEIVTRDLALGLLRAGHEPCVFTPRPGSVAEEIISAGVPVVSRLDAVPFRPDIIHGHHHVETTLALIHFGTTPAIFVCHDRLAWHDAPPRIDGIRWYVAVDHNCLERLTNDAGIPKERTRLILNAVDLHRFAPRSRLPRTPGRALVFSNYAENDADLGMLREVCEEAGMEFSAVGESVGAQARCPEQLLGDYDLVFAKARCALEALAVGCAVILWDPHGLGSMVTSSQAQGLREWNFGRRCLQGALAREAIRAEISRYDSEDAERVSEFVRSHASLDDAVGQYIGLYEDAVADARGVRISVGEVVESLARGAGSLESMLRRAGEPLAMPPLPETITPHISLRLAGAAPRMRAGDFAEIPMEIDNRSAEVLASLPPFPVHFSYHWLDAASRATVVFEGERTALQAPVRARARHSQRLRVRAPEQPGTYVLVVTLVQEHRFWFDTTPAPVAAELNVIVADIHTADWTLGEVSSWTGTRVVRDGNLANLGFLSDPKPRMLAFVETGRNLDAALRCSDLAAVITTAELGDAVPDGIAVAVADDPKAAFFRIHNRLANETDFYGSDSPSTIDASARLHPRCWIDERNVVIGAGVVIGANAAVLGRATIGAGSVIHAGAVIGSAGFQTSRRRGDLMELTHAGAVDIGAGCHIFANAVIARGLFRESTHIGAGCRVGNSAFVSHNCSVGEEAFIGHGAVVNGNVRVGSHTWIGPGATVVHGIEIGEGANVSLGATVMRDVEAGKHVTGSMAIAHRKMLRLMAAAEGGKQH